MKNQLEGPFGLVTELIKPLLVGFYPILVLARNLPGPNPFYHWAFWIGLDLKIKARVHYLLAGWLKNPLGLWNGLTGPFFFGAFWGLEKPGKRKTWEEPLEGESFIGFLVEPDQLSLASPVYGNKGG